MSSTQKQPKHHSHNSSTQDSVKPTRDGAGRPANPYKSGSNVHKGNVPKPPKPVAMSEPFKKTY